MKEIRVYHSLWKSVFLIAICFGFVAFGLHVLSEFSSGGMVVIWLGVLLFGLGGLFMLWVLLKERNSGQAYYVITADSITMNSGFKSWTVRFADVDGFFLTRAALSNMIGIRYKQGVQVRKLKESGQLGRMVRQFNEQMSDTQEGLPADGLTMKPDALCNLLNERVQQLREA